MINVLGNLLQKSGQGKEFVRREKMEYLKPFKKYILHNILVSWKQKKRHLHNKSLFMKAPPSFSQALPDSALLTTKTLKFLNIY